MRHIWLVISGGRKVDRKSTELERYGGPASMALSEQVFGLDSTIICHILDARQRNHLTLDAQMVAVLTLDRFLEVWGWDFQQRLFWLGKRVAPYESSQEFRPIRPLYCELLSPQDPRAHLQLAEQRAHLLELFQPQEHLLAEIGKQVRELATHQSLYRSESELVASLLHMHCNRLAGMSRTLERQTYAFWYHKQTTRAESEIVHSYGIIKVKPRCRF